MPILRLDKSLGSTEDLARIRDNLSAIVLGGDHLWLGGDEGAHIDRMTRDGRGNFGRHRRFNLEPLLKLPVAPKKKSEIDIEGLDLDSGYLWLIGSHSLKRDKPEDDKTPHQNRDRLANVEAEGNRYTLGRVPLDANSEPAKRRDSLRAALLEGDDKGDLLTKALAGDRHIGPFCRIPSKDNGLDIEGLAVRNHRAFVGLRGPVLRGWAVVLEIELKDSAHGAMRFAKSPRKHFLQLEGLGVRELAIHRKDLYILAGPTMGLDGPVFVYRWPKALDNTTQAFLPRNRLRKVLAVPYGTGKNRGLDHAEGIALIGRKDSAPAVMICYDSPSRARRLGDHGVRADVFDLAAADIDSI
ncbi:MAG: DUF3616 domain-containing protein [Bryobacteraceae bacterium]